MQEKIWIPTSGGLQLAGRFVAPERAGLCPAVLFLHGSGKIDSRSGYHHWQDHLRSYGMASLFFEFRGCGASQGVFAGSCLSNRLVDAQHALQFMASQPGVDAGRIAVVGGSMGGHVAVRLLEAEPRVGALVLVSAAAYSEEAEGQPLGAPFSRVIRRPDDWARSPVFKILQEAGKPVLLVYAEQDAVIPPGVQDAYRRAIEKQPGSRALQLEGGGHSLLNPQDEAGQRAMEALFAESAQFLKNHFEI